jgi:hypothetical protein
MLRQLLRHLRPALHADFVAVELSDTFQTLSRRIEAMKNHKPMSRRQWMLAAGLLSLLAVAVIPWRVVAQEAPQTKPTQPTPAPALAPTNESATSTPSTPPPTTPPELPAGDSASPPTAGRSDAEEQQQMLREYRRRYSPGDAPSPAASSKRSERTQIVGAWRGSTGTIVFDADGTYSASGNPLLLPRADRQGQLSRGKWQLEIFAPDPEGKPNHPQLQIIPGNESSVMRGLPVLSRQPVSTMVENYFDAVLINDQFLRLLTLADDGGTLFFRRDDKANEKPKLDPSLPADVRQFAELASLAADEVAALAAAKTDYFKAWEVNEKQVEQLLKLAAARRGQIDFAELFALDKEEMAAYAELFKLTKGNFNAIRALIAQDQLTDVELRAAKKVDVCASEMLNVAQTIGRAPWITSGRKLPEQPLPQSLDPHTRALAKLHYATEDLIKYTQGFLWVTFKKAPPW